MKRKTLYCSYDLCEIIVAQIIDDIRHNLNDKTCYSRETFYNCVTAELVDSFLKEITFSDSKLKLTTFESLTFFQKKICVKKIFQARGQDISLFDKETDKVLRRKNKNVILNRLSDEILAFNKCYSFISEYHVGHSEAGHIYQIPNLTFCIFNVPREADLNSHFYVKDIHRFCSRVYISAQFSKFSRDFTWNETKTIWELDIFKPPYSPLVRVRETFWMSFFITLLFNGQEDDIVEKNITISIMNHCLTSEKRHTMKRLMKRSKLSTIYDENHCLQYSENRVKLVKN